MLIGCMSVTDLVSSFAAGAGSGSSVYAQYSLHAAVQLPNFDDTGCHNRGA